jgi:hypothetical protein
VDAPDRAEDATVADVDHVKVVTVVISSDEAEPVSLATHCEAEGRIRPHIRRNAHRGAALERNTNEMAALIPAGVVVIVDSATVGREKASADANVAIRQHPQASGRHVPRVQLERARYVTRDDATLRRTGSDLHSADNRHAEARLPPRLVVSTHWLHFAASGSPSSFVV